MPVIRSSEQPSQTLEEFYQDLVQTSTNAYAGIAAKMLAMLDMLNEIFRETTVYALTSHAWLVLLADDNWRSDWLITVSSSGLEVYDIEYLMTKDKAPWQGASVRGTADSLDEARAYIQIAIR